MRRTDPDNNTDKNTNTDTNTDDNRYTNTDREQTLSEEGSGNMRRNTRKTRNRIIEANQIQIHII